MLSDTDFDELCRYCDLPLSSLPDPLAQDSAQGDELLSAVTESELTRIMQTRAATDAIALNFLAAGSYNNFIPAAVKAARQDDIAQPLTHLELEHAKHAIQNSLAALAAMPFCTLFQHDSTTLLANLLMACHAAARPIDQKGRSRVLIPATIAPAIRNALRTRLKFQAIDLIVIDYDKNSGCLSLEQLEKFNTDEVLAIVLAWPNFFGLLEDVSLIANWAKKNGSRVIGLTNPLILSYLESPFVLTQGRVDYLLGDLQCMGLSNSQHGAAPSFLASANALSSASGLSAGRQNEDIHYLPVIQAYNALQGVSGLYRCMQTSNQNLLGLVQQLEGIAGISIRFSSSWVNECVIEIAHIDLEKALKILAGHNMVLGYSLQDDYPELANCLLIYCSDQHTDSDRDKLVNKVTTVVKNLSTAGCPVKPKF